MKKSRSVKIFNLVTSLQSYPQSPTKDVEQGQKDSLNLFQQKTPERSNVIHFQEDRAFEYCGVKELKAYYQRARKLSKDKRRDTMQMSIGYSRCSAVSNKEDQLYSKCQILQRVEGKIEKITYMEDSTLSRFDRTMRQTAPVQGKQLKTRLKKEILSTQASSILKMKDNFHNYKEKWEKSSQQVEQTKGFPSILRLATQSRSSRVQKEMRSQKFKKENINQRMWATNLREKTELKNVYDKSFTNYIDHDENFTLAGKSKLQLEKNWVSEKGDKGYRFQLLNKGSSKA